MAPRVPRVAGAMCCSDASESRRVSQETPEPVVPAILWYRQCPLSAACVFSRGAAASEFTSRPRVAAASPLGVPHRSASCECASVVRQSRARVRALLGGGSRRGASVIWRHGSALWRRRDDPSARRHGRGRRRGDRPGGRVDGHLLVLRGERPGPATAGLVQRVHPAHHAGDRRCVDRAKKKCARFARQETGPCAFAHRVLLSQAAPSREARIARELRETRATRTHAARQRRRGRVPGSRPPGPASRTPPPFASDASRSPLFPRKRSFSTRV